MRDESPLPAAPGTTAAPVLRIRRAAAADLPALVALEEAGFADAWSDDSLAVELTYPESIVLLAEVAEVSGAEPRAAGYAAYRAVLGEGELLRLAVAPERRRHRVASALLAAGDEALAAARCDTCFLEVRSDNHGALAFYAERGFHRIGRRRGYYGQGHDALLLARAVRPRARPESPPAPLPEGG